MKPSEYISLSIPFNSLHLHTWHAPPRYKNTHFQKNMNATITSLLNAEAISERTFEYVSNS